MKNKTDMTKKTFNQPERENRAFEVAVNLEHRAEGEGEGRRITGYAAVFDKWGNPLYWFREKIDARAFEGCNFDDCILCFNHDADKIMARTSSGTLKLEVDSVGLKFSAELPNTTVGNDVLELVRRGDINKCSFAFHVAEDSWLYANEDNGLKLSERTILKIDYCFDVSPVVRPSYNDTTVDARALEERKAAYLGAADDETQAKAAAEAESQTRARELELLTLKSLQ